MPGLLSGTLVALDQPHPVASSPYRFTNDFNR